MRPTLRQRGHRSCAFRRRPTDVDSCRRIGEVIDHDALRAPERFRA